MTDLATADLYTARTLADTLQAVVDGIVSGFGYELAAINLVRPDGDLVVAAVAGSTSAEALMAGRVGSRAAWEQRLTVGEDQDGLRFIPHSEGRILDEDGVPELFAESSEPYDEGRWNPGDRLYAPMFTIRKELLGVLSVDRPRNGHRPGPEGRNALTAYAFHASIAISNARLRANMQRALVRLEREQQALRASEESFRQAFEYAPSGAAIAEMGGDQHGRIVRANDALCRLLERPAVALRRLSLVDLVHPEDIGTMLNTEAEGGRSEVRLARRDGKYLWVSLRTSVVAEPDDGPKYLLTHVTDIEERKIHEKDATYDALTGLLSEAGLRRHLAGQLCGVVPEGKGSADAMMASASSMSVSRSHRHKGEPGGALPGLAVLHYGLDGFKAINTRFGHEAGDKVLAEIAHRLLDAASSYNCEIEIARIRGDEFIVLMNDPDSSRVPHKAADQMRGACHRRISLGGKNGTVQLDAKFVVHWASCGSSANQVLQRSATLLYEKKRQSSKFRGG
ncbi:diguanylate cyclase domain-containing protein [Streptomyces sp. NPDC048197]|uniref:diguanylate cyclase domain-containing protein n=1 Tax=Streptomyces sp. NPDC048197 TaxID=3365511 RepID=UPI003723D5EF